MANTNDSATGGYLASSSAPPDEDNSLDAILQKLVVGNTGLPGNLVRPRWQPNPPAVPEATIDWCAIGVIDEDPEPNIALVHDGSGQGSSTSYSHTILRVMASFYGPNARGNAERLRISLMIGQNRESLYWTGLALMEIPEKSIFVPELVNTQTLRHVDITLRFRQRVVMVWPILNLVEFDGTLNASGGEINQMKTPTSVNPLKE